MESSVDISLIAPGKTLRVIPFNTFHGAFNMAVDFFLAQNIHEQDDPILRFYGWNPACLSLGRHQDESLVSREMLAKDGISLVRRPTGGSAILHEMELTYSLIVPNGQEQHHSIYALFHQVLARSLQHAGYRVGLHERAQDDNYLKEQKKSFACFNRPAFTEITFEGKKLVGSAQKLYRNSLLQHGSIMISGEQTRVLDYLVLTDEERNSFKNKIRETAINLTTISPKGITAYNLSNQITEEFARHGVHSIYYRQLTRSENESAQALRAQFERTFM